MQPPKIMEFFGLEKNNSNNWIILDSQKNMDMHNAKNYKGIYGVSNTGPFQCFKIEAVESFYSCIMLTFRRFDVYAKVYFNEYPHSKCHIRTSFQICYIYSYIFILIGKSYN